MSATASSARDMHAVHLVRGSRWCALEGWQYHTYTARKRHQPSGKLLSFSLSFDADKTVCKVELADELPADCVPLVTVAAGIPNAQEGTRILTDHKLYNIPLGAGLTSVTHRDRKKKKQEEEMPRVAVVFEDQDKEAASCSTRHAPQTGAVAQGLHSFITHKPAVFGGVGGRFTLCSTEGHEFYVHHSVMALFSPKLEEWMLEDHGGINGGEPLSVQCSTKALQLLLDLVYLGTLDNSCAPVLHEMAQVSNQWLMLNVVDECHAFMGELLAAAPSHEFDFELLLLWFVCVCQIESESNKALQKTIFVLLLRIAGFDTEKRAIVRAQLREFLILAQDDGFDVLLEMLTDQQKV